MQQPRVPGLPVTQTASGCEIHVSPVGSYHGGPGYREGVRCVGDHRTLKRQHAIRVNLAGTDGTLGSSQEPTGSDRGIGGGGKGRDGDYIIDLPRMSDSWIGLEKGVPQEEQWIALPPVFYLITTEPAARQSNSRPLGFKFHFYYIVYIGWLKERCLSSIRLLYQLGNFNRSALQAKQCLFLFRLHVVRLELDFL